MKFAMFARWGAYGANASGPSSATITKPCSLSVLATEMRRVSENPDERQQGTASSDVSRPERASEHGAVQSG